MPDKESVYRKPQLPEDGDEPYMVELSGRGGGYPAFSGGKRELRPAFPNDRAGFRDTKEKYGMRYAPYCGLKRVSM